jgi:hypothetical protein
LDEVVLGALEKEPDDRYQQASEVKEDVKRSQPPRHNLKLDPQMASKAFRQAEGGPLASSHVSLDHGRSLDSAGNRHAHAGSLRCDVDGQWNDAVGPAR